MLEGLDSSSDFQLFQFPFKAFGDCSNPSMQITIDITVILMFHSFLSYQARSKYFSLFLLSLIFTKWSDLTVKSTI